MVCVRGIRAGIPADGADCGGSLSRKFTKLIQKCLPSAGFFDSGFVARNTLAGKRVTFADLFTFFIEKKPTFVLKRLLIFDRRNKP